MIEEGEKNIPLYELFHYQTIKPFILHKSS